MINLDRFRLWLKQKMLERGYNYKQKDLAADLKIRPATVSSWFKVNKPPTDESIWALAIWGNTDPPEIYEVLGLPVPADYSPLKFWWMALFDKLSEEKRVQVLDELGSPYVAKSGRNPVSEQKARTRKSQR